jgi:hypothetical protein
MDAPLSEEEWKLLILAEVDPDGSAGAATYLDLYWRGNLRWGAVSVELRALLTEQQLARFVLRSFATKRDWTAAGVTQKDSQVFDHLQALLTGLETRIAALQRALAAQSGPLIGPLTKTAPTMPNDPTNLNPDLCDPNDPAWRGSPVGRSG